MSEKDMGSEEMIVSKSEMDKAVWREPLVLGEDQANSVILPETMLKIIDNDYVSVILRAPAGIGKTSGVINWGLENGMSVFVQECASDMADSDLTGTWGLEDGSTKFLAGEIASAFRLSKEYEKEWKEATKGMSEKEADKVPKKKVLLLMDEINLLAPAVLKSIGSVFDFRRTIYTPVGRVYGAPEFLRVVGTMNSEEDSSGYLLDPALRSRCLVLTIPIKEVIENLGKAQGNVNKVFLQVMEQTNAKFSIREMEQLVVLKQIMVGGKPMDTSTALMYVLDKYDEDERKIIQSVFSSVSKTSLSTDDEKSE
jgi:hypothetical protein